jgi:hypothetical protein
MRGLDTNDLVLRRSRPAEVMRFKYYNAGRHTMVFKTGENEHGETGYTCPVEHYEDMITAEHWELLNESDIPAEVKEP